MHSCHQQSSTIVVLQNGARCQTPLPLDVITDINTVINQNQLICEELAIKHCRLQDKLRKLDSDSKQLRFYRRRDLRYLFESAKDILWHYWRTESDEDPDFGALVSVQNYVKASLESFVDCVMQASEVGSQGTCSTSCTSSSSSSSSDYFHSSTKERVSVNDNYDSIELELFIPAVAFSETVTYHSF